MKQYFLYFLCLCSATLFAPDEYAFTCTQLRHAQSRLDNLTFWYTQTKAAWERATQEYTTLMRKDYLNPDEEECDEKQFQKWQSELKESYRKVEASKSVFDNAQTHYNIQRTIVTRLQTELPLIRAQWRGPIIEPHE